MLYVLLGNNIVEKQKERAAILATAKKAGELLIERRTSESVTAGELLTLSESVSMFGERIVVILEEAYSVLEKEGEALSLLKQLAQSENYFIFLETDLKKDAKTLFEKAKGTVISKELPKIAKPRFNVFTLTDYVGNRDKKKAWYEYQRALAAGIDPREITGVLFWVFKNMVLVHEDNSGLSPFVYKKTLSFIKKWKESELTDSLEDLVTLYHQGQYGRGEFPLLIEQFLLTRV